jgi:hypothetical protein
MPVLDLPDDAALPPGVGAFVFEQDLEYLLRVDREPRYPREPTAELLAAAQQAPERVCGMVYAIEGSPLYLMAVVHDLGQEPSWRSEWIAAAYHGLGHEVKERGLRALVTPLLGTVHGRFDPVLSLAMLEAGMRLNGVDPEVWVRTPAGRG